MIIACAMLVGALTSAAWIAQPPVCYVFIAIATVLFVMIKQTS